MQARIAALMVMAVFVCLPGTHAQTEGTRRRRHIHDIVPEATRRRRDIHTEAVASFTHRSLTMKRPSTGTYPSLTFSFELDVPLETGDTIVLVLPDSTIGTMSRTTADGCGATTFTSTAESTNAAVVLTFSTLSATMLPGIRCTVTVATGISATTAQEVANTVAAKLASSVDIAPIALPTAGPPIDTVVDVRQRLGSTGQEVVLFRDSGEVISVEREECYNPVDVAEGVDGALYLACHKTNDEYVHTIRDGRALKLRDRAFYHYQIGISGISIVDDILATCQNNANDYAGTTAPNYFMGLSLYNLSLPLIRTTGEVFNGSDPLQVPYLNHIDMLHETPNCLDLISLESSGFNAHVTNNYLVVDAFSKQLVKVNFLSPHGPGVMDHSTARVQRLYNVPISGINVSLAVDLNREVAYVADAGAGHLLAVDYNTGQCNHSARADYPIFSSHADTFSYTVCEDTVWRLFAVVPRLQSVAVYQQGVYVLAHTVGGASVVHTYAWSGSHVHTLTLNSGASKIRSLGDRLMLVYSSLQQLKPLTVDSSTVVAPSSLKCNSRNCPPVMTSERCSLPTQCMSYNCSSLQGPPPPHQVTWQLGMTTSEQSLSVEAGNEVQFNWNGYHNVYLMTDATKYAACDFTGAQMVASTSPGIWTVPSSASPGTQYFFACEVGSHCNNDQKITVSVSPISGNCANRSHVGYNTTNALTSYIGSAAYQQSVAAQIVSGGYLHTYPLMDCDFCESVKDTACDKGLDFNALLLGNCWDHKCLPTQLMCLNGGVLQKISAKGYRCVCTDGWTGDTCEVPAPPPNTTCSANCTIGYDAVVAACTKARGPRFAFTCTNEWRKEPMEDHVCSGVQQELDTCQAQLRRSVQLQGASPTGVWAESRAALEGRVLTQQRRIAELEEELRQTRR